MGAGLIDAAQLLNNIKNKELSSDMKLPNVYVGIEKTVSLNLAAYFAGQTEGYSCSVVNGNVASASVEGKTLTVKGLAAGSTSLTVTGKARKKSDRKANIFILHPITSNHCYRHSF